MPRFGRLELETVCREEDDGPTLPKVLGAVSLTLIGVSNAIGAGIFVLTGTAAATYAGPGVTFSYVIAGAVCLLTALCYAELSSIIPGAGGSYSYARVTLGRIPAWLIGWCMVLMYLIAASTVAVGWSGYFVELLASFHVNLPHALTTAPLMVDARNHLVSGGGIFNMPAAGITLLCTAILTFGVHESMKFNTVIVGLKIVLILLVIVAGAAFVNPGNWDPFIPPSDPQSGRFGWGGIFAASAIAFFSYTGFEVLATSARESRNAARDIPRAMIAALAICTALYVAMALVMTGLANYRTLDTASPVITAIQAAGPGLRWLIPVIGFGTVVGLMSVVFVSLYGQSRVFYEMARAQQAPALFARVDERRGSPASGTLTIGIIAALIAGGFPLAVLGELVSMGCLIAFASVCAGVLIMRRLYPYVPRPFRIPGGFALPLLGLLSCVGLMASLPAATWLYLIVWLLIGAVFAAFLPRRTLP